jgi:hypothetical protein
LAGLRQFGNKLHNYQPLLSNGVNPFTGDSFEEIVGELNNMSNMYRYDNLTNTAGIYQDPIGGYRLSINGNVKVGNVGRARRLRSYKEWVYKNRMKAEAGMTHARNNTTPE